MASTDFFGMKSFSRSIHSTGETLAENLDNLVWSVRGTLRAASFGYGAAIRIRAATYRCVPFSRHRVAAHVVSVGNITVGGTGKTPVTEYVARRYIDAGRRVAILSRGYGRPAPTRDVVVVSSGDGLLEPDWRRTGDEPQLLARNVSFSRAPWAEEKHYEKYFHSGSFAGRLGLRVVSPILSVVDDPSLKAFEGTPLVGHYKVDDEGIPAQRVLLIDVFFSIGDD